MAKQVRISRAEMVRWTCGGLKAEIENRKQEAHVLKQRIAELERQLREIDPGNPPEAVTAEVQPVRKRRRRKMSAEARKRISVMMKKRWAERRKARK
ncbi:MAG: hypothetical protein KW788_01300 [Candidatus Doudnabacteria bacterium]|nr:hypothetical protein [Candidatus Doudnabacteria bacterium]